VCPSKPAARPSPRPRSRLLPSASLPRTPPLTATRRCNARRRSPRRSPTWPPSCRRSERPGRARGVCKRSQRRRQSSGGRGRPHAWLAAWLPGLLPGLLGQMTDCWERICDQQVSVMYHYGKALIIGQKIKLGDVSPADKTSAESVWHAQHLVSLEQGISKTISECRLLALPCAINMRRRRRRHWAANLRNCYHPVREMWTSVGSSQRLVES
jgi:hypothetical protein